MVVWIQLHIYTGSVYTVSEIFRNFLDVCNKICSCFKYAGMRKKLFRSWLGLLVVLNRLKDSKLA